MRSLLFIIICFVGFFVGTAIATYVFFGIVTLIGLIALVESSPFLKKMFERGSTFIDVLIFALTIGATLYMGVTIAATLTVAGLGFTLVYAPFIRNRKLAKKSQRKY